VDLPVALVFGCYSRKYLGGFGRGSLVHTSPSCSSSSSWSVLPCLLSRPLTDTSCPVLAWPSPLSFVLGCVPSQTHDHPGDSCHVTHACCHSMDHPVVLPLIAYMCHRLQAHPWARFHLAFTPEFLRHVYVICTCLACSF
jgi:hypothetical protein